MQLWNVRQLGVSSFSAYYKTWSDPIGLAIAFMLAGPQFWSKSWPKTMFWSGFRSLPGLKFGSKKCLASISKYFFPSNFRFMSLCLFSYWFTLINILQNIIYQLMHQGILAKETHYRGTDKFSLICLFIHLSTI